jgi:hypothetical protein
MACLQKLLELFVGSQDRFASAQFVCGLDEQSLNKRFFPVG